MQMTALFEPVSFKITKVHQYRRSSGNTMRTFLTRRLHKPIIEMYEMTAVPDIFDEGIISAEVTLCEA